MDSLTQYVPKAMLSDYFSKSQLSASNTMTVHFFIVHPMFLPETSIVDRPSLAIVKKGTMNRGIVHPALERKPDMIAAPQVSQVRKCYSGFCNSWCDLPNTSARSNQASEVT